MSLRRSPRTRKMSEQQRHFLEEQARIIGEIKRMRRSITHKESFYTKLSPYISHDKDECFICFNEHVQQMVRSLCGHLMCRKCAAHNMTVGRNECPFCRQIAFVT